jgi:Xaa-Pro aminopeptidase
VTGVTPDYQARAARVRARMAELGVDALLLSVGADLPWLTGYTAMPLERLTMLVLPADGDTTLLIPRLEEARVTPRPDLFTLRAWDETEDAMALVAALVGSHSRLAVSDRTWATFLLGLQAAIPHARWVPASTVMVPLRAVKDDAELDALRRAGAAADRVAAQLLAGRVPLVGRTEAEVARDLGHRLLAEGHERVNFTIVGGGPNSASPHHEPGGRRIGPGEAVLCDFGGTVDGYCSDITRTVFTGPPPAEFAEIYAVVQEAQAAGRAAVAAGIPAQDVDRVARDIIATAGFGEYFVHRLGHGVGLEEHEDPFLVQGNDRPLEAGNAFSVEPGIYVPGRWGVRIEDVVAITGDGPEALNRADHALVAVDA